MEPRVYIAQINDITTLIILLILGIVILIYKLAR
jgi:hypothetical protein